MVMYIVRRKKQLNMDLFNAKKWPFSENKCTLSFLELSRFFLLFSMFTCVMCFVSTQTTQTDETISELFSFFLWKSTVDGFTAKTQTQFCQKTKHFMINKISKFCSVFGFKVLLNCWIRFSRSFTFLRLKTRSDYQCLKSSRDIRLHALNSQAIV